MRLLVTYASKYGSPAEIAVAIMAQITEVLRTAPEASESA